MAITLVDEWLDWLRVDRKRSPNTIAAYRRALGTLTDPEHATREDVEAWSHSRAHLSESTRNQELSAVRQFYKWCGRWEHRDDDPTLRLDQLKRPHRISRFVGRSDLDRLLSSLPDDLRRAVALGAYGGLRVSEAASLSWSDVNLEARRIIVRGKGDKERSVGITTTLLDHLLPDTGGNIVRAGERPFSGHTLQQKVNAAIHAQGVDATFHKLRHRFGFKAAEAGIPATSIARAMGHESLTTTMGYIAAVDSDLDLIAEAVTR